VLSLNEIESSCIRAFLNKPVTARFWPCLEPFQDRKFSKPFKLLPFKINGSTVGALPREPDSVGVTIRFKSLALNLALRV
jgi:hypothetical protein